MLSLLAAVRSRRARRQVGITRVLATCEECGPVEIDVTDVTLRRRSDSADVLFECTLCQQKREHPVPRGLIGVLEASEATLAIQSDGVEAGPRSARTNQRMNADDIPAK